MARQFIRWFRSPKIALFKTLYINFRALKFKDALKFPILVYDSHLKVSSVGKMHFTCPVKYGLVDIGKGFFFSSSRGELCNTGTIVFHGKCHILNGTKISNHGIIELGDNCSFGEDMKIIIWDSLKLGRMNRFAYGTTIMDTSGHPVADIKTGEVRRFTRGIELADYCWVGNSCKLCPGTKIPSHTIISNFSLLNKNYMDIGDYCMLGGIPAKVLRKSLVKIEKIDLWDEIKEKFRQNPNIQSLNIKNIIDNDLASLSDFVTP